MLFSQRIPKSRFCFKNKWFLHPLGETKIHKGEGTLCTSEAKIPEKYIIIMTLCTSDAILGQS